MNSPRDLQFSVYICGKYIHFMNIAVYLGSSQACLPEYNDLAFELGKTIALKGHTLVYGGANVGTMKLLADGAASVGGNILGVFPKGFLGTIEVIQEGLEVMRELSDMIITRDFAERKQVMEDKSDCCIVMPGSFGTLDELFTYACNRSIGLHSKPIYLLNYKGYYEPLKAMLANMSAAGFLKPSTVGVLTFVDTIDQLPL